MTRKKGHNANAAASRNLGGPTDKYTIEDAVKLVSFSFLSAPDKFPSWIEKIAWENISFVYQSNIGPTAKTY